MRLLTCGYVDIGNCQSHPWSGIPHCHPSPSAITSYHKLSAAYLCYQLKLNIGHFHLVRIRHWHFTAASQERRSQCWHWVLVGLGGSWWVLVVGGGNCADDGGKSIGRHRRQSGVDCLLACEPRTEEPSCAQRRLQLPVGRDSTPPGTFGGPLRGLWTFGWKIFGGLLNHNRGPKES